MSRPIIEVENLSKRYRLGQFNARTMREEVEQFFARFRNKRGCDNPSRTSAEFWALKDVSFSVQRGEIIGIIGRNGAGKSTLLKILSRITRPTAGEARIRGRVSSLLEVGTGFHGELTGRENIYLNGAILGMTQPEIRRKFDEIVAFADVEKFLDTPVKRYSSGMYVRLAFAIAAHLEPDILIVDEVLAVGDSEFQKKCLGKMEEVSRRDGRTVLFVTHNMSVVVSLCPSATWLDKGMIVRRGDSREVIKDYLALNGLNREHLINLEQCLRSGGDGRLRLLSLEWLSAIPLQHGHAIRGRIQFRTYSPLHEVTVGIGFSNFEGQRLLTYETDFPHGHRPSLMKPGKYTVEFEVDSLPLAPDIYYLDIGGRSGDVYGLDYIRAGVELEVVPGAATPAYITRRNAGVRLPSKWLWSNCNASRPIEIARSD
jgi:lipopolysaccharide transport system ATP-binding protein